MKKLLLPAFILLVSAGLFAQDYRLVLPKDNWVTSSGTVNFEWSSVPGATSYDLEWDTDPAFSNPTISANISATTKTLTFVQLRTYYWRIKANGTTLDWSYSRGFTLFSPTQINGLLLWFDAGVGVTQTANKVSTWADQSGNGTNASQINAPNQPTYVPSSSCLCGRPAISFDGSTSQPDYLNFTQQIFNEFSNFIVRNYVNNTNLVQCVMSGHGQCARGFNINSEADYYHGGYGIYSPSCSTPAESQINSLPGVNTGTCAVYTSQFMATPGHPGSYTPYIARDGIAPPLTGTVNTDMGAPTLDMIGDRSDLLSLLPYQGEIGEIIHYNTYLDSTTRLLVEQYLRYKYSRPVDLGPDTSYNQFCVNATLSPRGGCYTSYTWSTQEHTATITAHTVGTYWVQATDNMGYVSTDTIVIRPSLPVHELQDNITICQGDSVIWHTGYPATGFTYHWTTGETTDSIIIRTTGDYAVTITDVLNCEYHSDTTHVFVDQFPVSSIGPHDTAICAGNSLGFPLPDSLFSSVLWSTTDITTTTIVTAPGVYTVMATSINGCVARDTINVTIKGIAPTVNFSSPIWCVTDTLQFIDNSQPPGGDTLQKWFWTFGDGGTDTLQNPQHVYTSPGNYTTCLTVETEVGCSNTLCKMQGAYLKPHAAFQATISCAFAQTFFTDNSTTVAPAFDSLWKWHFTPTDSSILQSPNFSYPAPGRYEVSVVVTNSDGCTDRAIDTVEVFAPFDADFDIQNVCFGDSTIFTDQTQSLSVVSWLWNAGDNFFTNQRNFKHKYLAPGIYNITLRLENAIGCIAIDTASVHIYPPPIAGFNAGIVCEDQTFAPDDTSTVYEAVNTWNWNIAGSHYTGQTPQHFFANTGNYPVTLIVTSESGCADTSSLTVFVAPTPHADFTFSPTFGDAPLTADFHDQSTGAASLLWDFGDGATATDTAPVHTYMTENTYPITLYATSTYGCRDSITKTILVTHTDLDLSVDYVTTSQAPQPDGTVRVTVTAYLSNLGTRLITHATLYATIGSGGVISEEWNGSLTSGASTTYTFAASFVVSAANANSYVCVNAVSVNHGEQETRIDNNVACSSITGIIQMLGPSPSPARGNAYMGFILPKPGKVYLDVVDVIGQIVMPEIELDLPSGRSDWAVPVKQLRYGEYFIRIRHNDDKFVKKLMVD